MSHIITLSIDISSYWFLGSGRGSGNHLDALVDKDADGLPFISGRMLKGLLRDSVNRLEQWGQLNTVDTKGLTIVDYLFGSAGYKSEDEEYVARDQTVAGKIRVSDAILPDELRHWLAYQDNKRQRQQLYHEVYSTAIDAHTGVAKEHSLRGMEVTIPLSLEAQLELEINSDVAQWQEIIAEALHLIRAVGGQRSRGYGRALLQVKGN